MNIKIIRDDGVTEFHSTETLIDKDVLGKGVIATTCKLRLDRLSTGIWMDVWFHDTKDPFEDDTEITLDPWDVARPMAAQRLWLVPKGEMSHVLQVFVDDKLSIKRLPGGAFVDMAKFELHRASLQDNKDAYDIFIDLCFTNSLEPNDPKTIGTLAPLMGWPEDELHKLIIIQEARTVKESFEGVAEDEDDNEAEEAQ